MHTTTLSCAALFSVVPVLTLLFTVTGKFNFSGLVRHLLEKNVMRGDAVSVIVAFVSGCLRCTRDNMFVKVNVTVLL